MIATASTLHYLSPTRYGGFFGVKPPSGANDREERADKPTTQAGERVSREVRRGASRGRSLNAKIAKTDGRVLQRQAMQAPRSDGRSRRRCLSARRCAGSAGAGGFSQTFFQAGEPGRETTCRKAVPGSPCRGGQVFGSGLPGRSFETPKGGFVAEGSRPGGKGARRAPGGSERPSKPLVGLDPYEGR